MALRTRIARASKAILALLPSASGAPQTNQSSFRSTFSSCSGPNLLQLQPDCPAPGQIIVAVELKRRHVVVSTHAPCNRQTFVGFHVPDLVDPAAGHVADPPGARRITVAVELKGRHIIVGAHSPGDR